MCKNISIILSGGVGIRFGNEMPKQYQMLLGEEVIAYVVGALKQSTFTGRLLIVARTDDMERLKTAYGVDCAPAGETHNGSIKNALDYIQANFSVCANVLFVDAARPFLTADTVDKYYNFLKEYDGVITAQHITDSLGFKEEMFVDRSHYFLIQKPEAFRFAPLYSCFTRESSVTAIVQQMPPGSKIMKCFDIRQNLKITYPEDLSLAEHLMASRLKENYK